MIQMPMLSENDLSFFSKKKVLLYSHKHSGVELCRIFSRLGVKVLCCCIEEEQTLFQKIKDRVRGLNDISPSELSCCLNNNENIIMQSIEFDLTRIKKVEEIAQSYGVAVSPITSGEIMSAFSSLLELERLENPMFFLYKRLRQKYNYTRIVDKKWADLKQKKIEELLFICSPPKTADHSLMATFDDFNVCENQKEKNVNYVNLWHQPKAIKHVRRKRNIEKIKVLIGLRDPISQNLSTLYQNFSTGRYAAFLLFVHVELGVNVYRSNIIEKYKTLLQQDNADKIQLMWNDYINLYTNAKKKLGNEKIHTEYIQSFVPMFQNQVVDILEYPFDTEKGYTIIKEGNIEVFVYQLEKLNNLVPELSEWIGVLFDKLEKGNAAEDKWIAESYKQAQKEIEITQEYFDKCFDEPYVKHCYSEADIEKFKARWRPHIQKAHNK